MKIHHIGYMVANIEESSNVFKNLGFETIKHKMISNSQNVYISLLEKGGTVIELISPIDKSSSIYNLLEKIGPSPYHICFEVENLNEGLESLTKLGFKRITKVFHAEVFENKRAVFLYNTDIGLVEIIKKERRDYDRR